MKRIMTFLASGLLIASCGANEPPSAQKNAAPAPTNQAIVAGQTAIKGKTDYKSMFGPDYKKGDVGHSYGQIIDIKQQDNEIRIEHGVIHGTDLKPNTTSFSAMDSVDVTSFSSGSKVEFLIRKISPNNYRLFAICETSEIGKGCLKGN